MLGVDGTVFIKMLKVTLHHVCYWLTPEIFPPFRGSDFGPTAGLAISTGHGRKATRVIVQNAGSVFDGDMSGRSVL